MVVVAAVSGPVAEAQTSSPNPIGQDPFVPHHRYHGDFPDPAVLKVGHRYFAYSTATARLNLPVLRSTNTKAWFAARPPDGPHVKARPDALPSVPKWAWHGEDGRGVTWAPSVAHWHGRYLAAYTVRKRGAAHKMCISTAVSDSPRGPFIDHTRKPLVCPRNRGAIDPMLYREKGRQYLLFKTEDIAIGRPTRIWIRRLARSGRRFTEGRKHRLLTANQPWENNTIEAPAMVRFKGHRYLFYSAGGWASPRYAVGYAICRTVTGPCHRMRVRGKKGRVRHPPFLKRGDGLVGPGGASPFLDPKGRLRLAYHAWEKGAAHYPTSISCRTSPDGCGQRRLYVARLGVRANGSLVVRVRK